jgi:hypothetical protein
VSRLFDGSKFSIALLGGAVTVLMLMILGSLVLSDQLPPRPVGVVTGDIRAGLGGPAGGQQVIFERTDAPIDVNPDVASAYVFRVRADAYGHFSASLPPGSYYVDMTIAACPRIGPCEPRRRFFPFGTKTFAIADGQHVQLQLGTCDDIWQCHG